MKLTEAQFKCLNDLSSSWTEQPVGWRPGVVFNRLEHRKLCEAHLRYLPDPNKRRWWARLTPAGRAALEKGQADER